MIRAFALALALTACAAPAREQSAAVAFAPLIGCWRGEFENQPNIRDERCFQTLGDHVVDTHAVRPTTYSGETTYHLDEVSGEIVFAYASNDGGRSNGAVRIENGAYIFPAHTHHSADGTARRMRSTWAMDTGRLVISSETEEGGAWRPFMRIIYTRAADLTPPQ
ncbi:MAG TPA: hypothetical protein VEF55_04630 [Candidatus Binatia bacterium]|nr:hypothetical protein [Candidatus Binatia bacterium]